MIDNSTPVLLPGRNKNRTPGAIAIYGILAGLLFFALRNTPLAEIWHALAGLKLWQIGTILTINGFVITAMTARWWIIVRAEHPSMPFQVMMGYRLSAFGISYFTPGPQVGGEPLQVVFLQRNHGLSFARATSAVIIDKLLEFLGNFVFIGAGVWAILKEGVISGDKSGFTLGLIGLGILLLLPLVQIFMLYAGFHPISQIMLRLPFIEGTGKFARTIIVAERMASTFCRRHIKSLWVAILATLMAVAGMAVEYYLMVQFLGMRISVVQVFAALIAMQIAFLLPLPGGLGALEASQLYVLGAFGQPAAAAISLTLLIRARDILNGGIGLLFAGRGVPR